MRKTLIAGLLAIASLGSTPAFADAPLTSGGTATFDGGTGGLGAGETLYASFSPGSTAGAPAGMIYTGNTSGIAADPAVGGTGDPYLAVLGGEMVNFLFDGGLSQLGLDYGSADAYNSFQLFFADGTNQILTGQNIIDFGTADGNQSEPRTNGRLTFFAGTGPAITGLTLSSTGNSLEVDNFGTIGAVPEPGTWAMMLVGFGAAGFSLRRRRSNAVALQAA